VVGLLRPVPAKTRLLSFQMYVSIHLVHFEFAEYPHLSSEVNPFEIAFD
jgi:hypothetical protein